MARVMHIRRLLVLLWCAWMCMATIDVKIGLSPETGTIVTPFAEILTGQSTIDIIFQLPNIEEPEWYDYTDPCELTNLVIGLTKRMIISKTVDLSNAVTKLCHKFRHVKNTQTGLSEAYGMEMKRHHSVLEALRPRTRKTRSLGDDIRRFFGIANSDDQDELKHKVSRITKELFSHQGMLVNMTYAIKQQGEKIERLETAMSNYGAALNSTIALVNVIQNSLSSHVLLTNTHLELLQQVAGLSNIQHHMMSLHTSLLQQRATGMLALSKGELTPELISPTELQDVLNKLDEALNTAFPNMEHLQANVYDFYSTMHAVGYRDDDNIYVLVQVPLDFENQHFELYELTAFPLVVPDSEYATLVVPNKRHIAISYVLEAYFLLDTDYISRYCSGHELLRCEHLQLQRRVTTYPVCETAIVTGDSAQIEMYCQVLLIAIQSVVPEVWVLNSTHLHVSNPHALDFFLNCPNDRHLRFLSNLLQFTVQMPCFCQLTSENVATPTLFHEHCLDFNDKIPVVTQHSNDILVALANNFPQLADQNFTVTIPENAELQYPELVCDADSVSGLDAKQWFQLSYDQYENTLYGRITQQRLDMDTSRISWFLPSFSAYAVCFLITFIILIVLWLKFHSLASIVTVMTMVRPTAAATFTMSTPALVSLEILFVIVCICLIMSCVYRCYDLGKRIYRNTAATCCEQLTLDKPDNSKVLLYLGNLQTYVYLHLGDILTLPHEVRLLACDEPISLTMHRSCFNGFITLDKHKLILSAGDASFALPTAVAVPWHLQATVATLLRSPPIQVRLLVGREGVYQAFPIPCADANTVAIEEADT